MGSASETCVQALHTVASILAVKPAQRTAEDTEQLIAFLSEQPFFAGASPVSLELLSSCLGVQKAAPGEVVLHVGELTDRLYIPLNGSCTFVRHSRREGFQPQAPQQLSPGQALCEASLVLSSRRSDVAVTVSAAAPSTAGAGGDANAGGEGGNGPDCSGGNGGGGGGGATLMFLTRTAWNNMCARAPVKAEYGEARLTLLCCCARSLAATDPIARTLEQAEDLAALLRLLPGLSHTPAPVLRAMSESAYLRQLPAGTILFEECTRAESEFLVLAGAVEMYSRPKRQGAANRAALRSALRSAVAAARGKSAKGAPKGGAEAAPKTVRQKIEEERRAREQIKQSLALQRESLRTPKANSTRPTGARAVEDEFKKWMLEFLSRKRSADNPANAAAATSGVPVEGITGKPRLTRAVSIKAANAWRRAAAKALQSGISSGGGDDGRGGGAARTSTDGEDMTLIEYERRKMEEAGGLRDVGNLLGGAAARKAYMRGLAAKDGGMYAEDEPEDNTTTSGPNASRPAKPGGVHWGPQEDEPGVHGGGGEEPEVEDVDEEEADPWVRLTFLDRRYQVVRKAIKYIDAVEKVMGVAKQESVDSGKTPGVANPSSGQAATLGSNGDPDGDNEDPRAADELQLLLLNGSDDAATAAAAAGGAGSASATAATAATASAASNGPGPDDIVDDACEEHFEQLFGPCAGRLDVGQVAGELPAAVLDRPKKGAQQQRTKRAHSAITGPSGADVLVVALEALRKGHEAARDDLVSERLAVLTALEPLRGLSDEHQAQLALGCTVVNLDANQVVVRQGQLVDALFVVMEGEVKLLDDPDTTPTVAPPPPPPPPPLQQSSAGGATVGGGTTVSSAGSTTASGSAGSVSNSETPFRTVAAAAGGGKLMSLKIRRAAAALATLTLLGPGGSFGESVLGYPEGTAAAAASWGPAARELSEQGDAAESAVSQCQHLATAMTSRPTKLLMLPRSLLARYGYLRSSLPPLAQLRREVLNGRRQQLQTGLQSRPAVVVAAATASSPSNGGGGAPQPGPGQVPNTGYRIVRGGSDGFMGMAQLPSLTSPTAGGGSGAAAAAGTFQTPRPPPVKPSEVLEQMGFKPVLRRIYNAGSKLSGAGASGGGGAAAAPSSVNTAGATVAAVSNNCSGSGSSGSISSTTIPSVLPPPLPQTVNGFASAGGGGPERQHRRDLLAASVLAAGNPHSLSNAIARARAEDPPSLPMVVHSLSAAAAASSPLPYRGSVDGSIVPAAMAGTSTLLGAAVGGPGSGSPGGLILPTTFTATAAARVGMRPLRLSVSGVGSSGNDINSPSPVRRFSLSGVMIANSMAGGSSGGGISVPALASPPPPPLRGGGGSGATRSNPTFNSASNPHVTSVQLPRLSVAGNSSSGTPTPTAGGSGNGRRLARPSVPGEPFLVRLEGVESSPRSFSPQPSPGSHNAGRSASSGTLVGSSGATAPPPISATLLGQRSAGHQPMARA